MVYIDVSSDDGIGELTDQGDLSSVVDTAVRAVEAAYSQLAKQQQSEIDYLRDELRRRDDRFVELLIAAQAPPALASDGQRPTAGSVLDGRAEEGVRARWWEFWKP